MKDNINPQHYRQGKIEAIDAIESATMNKKGLDAVATANVIKYLWRCEDKGGLEDMKKAKWYLERMIAANEREIITFKSKTGVSSDTEYFSKL